MREKLETLPLIQLRELAKSQGIKNITVLRKSELIDKLCEAAERRGHPRRLRQKRLHRQLRRRRLR